MAYTLIKGLQRLALHDTRLARRYAGTVRLKLLKVGAVVTRNTRTIRLKLASHFPYQDLFELAYTRLVPG